MPYTPILATLGYVLSPDRARTLMVHRTGRAGDAHFGKYNGLGGKLERGEDPVAGMKRELREEAGIEATRLRLRGTINWPGFGAAGEDWFGFIFVIEEFTGVPPAANEEGPLEWVPLARVPELPLWEGDRLFLPLVFDLDGPAFHGVMPYSGGKPTGWQFSTLG
jgi:8-oxo-dGTP diphosphatase